MSKKKITTCYYAIDHGKNYWGVACVVEGENGYHPVGEYDYVGRDAEKKVRGIVDRLNERLGHGPADSLGHKLAVRRIVGSTMRKAAS